MNLEKLDIFEKKSDQLIVVLNSVKRLDPQKLIEFLFGSGEADLELLHKIFIRCNIGLCH
jgi:hypothetical protein